MSAEGDETCDGDREKAHSVRNLRAKGTLSAPGSRKIGVGAYGVPKPEHCEQSLKTYLTMEMLTRSSELQHSSLRYP